MRGPRAGAPRRSRYRLPLLILGPVLALAATIWIYLAGGRYVSEENSYVGATAIWIAPQVSGQVERLEVGQNQHVDPQTTLFVIDPEPYRIAVDGARAQLGITHDQIAGQLENYRARKQQAEQARANLTFARQQLARIQDLFGKGVATQAQLDAARRDEETAAATLAAAEAEARAALAQIGGDGELPIEQRPQYLAAKANLEAAERNLRLTDVKAPFEGVVTNVNTIGPGAFLSPGQQAISIVAIERPWVDSNLRETDLTHVKPGSPATVVADTYPNVTFNGHVESINPASGAVFALIPPQNATGNWVKVVQRIPVRIAIEGPPSAPTLRDGMSVTVTIDTGYRRTLSTLWRDIRGLL